MHTTEIRRIIATMTILVALPLLAADNLAVKTGLWEVSTVSKTSGMSIPADTLASLPPAQRAQMAKAFQELGAAGPVTFQDRTCVTAKDLQEGAFRQKPDSGTMDCKYRQISSSAKHQEFTFQCPAAQGNASGRMVIDATDSTHLRGSMEMKSTQLNISTKFESKWLSASCAGIAAN